MTQVSLASQLSPLLSVHSLSLHNNHKLPTGEEDVDSTQWLEFFQPFTHVGEVEVLEEKFVPGIVRALVAEDMATGVLLGLIKLCLSGYRNHHQWRKLLSSPSLHTGSPVALCI